MTCRIIRLANHLGIHVVIIILLLLMLEASGVFLVGLFLHENHVISQGHAGYCDSLARISVFSWLLEDNKRENDSSKRVRKDHNVFLIGDGCFVNFSFKFILLL